MQTTTETTDPRDLAFHLELSSHARRRAAHRAVSHEAICLTLLYGRRIKQQNGRRAFFVGAAEVQAAAREGVDLSGCEHTIVVTARDGAIVTVIRSSRGLYRRWHRRCRLRWSGRERRQRRRKSKGGSR